MQAPLKSRYRENPDSAVVTMTATGKLDPERITCHVGTHTGVAAAGLHAAAGGNGMEACSGDMLLQALAACAGVTLRAVATAMGIEIRGGNVVAEGDLDFRGTLGVDKTAPIGFRDIRLRFEIDTPAAEDQLATLLKLTERYCVVYQTLRHAPEIEVSHHATQQEAGYTAG